MVQEIWDRLSNLYWGMEQPGLTLALNILEIVRYAVTILCILVAEAAVFGVIAFGYVAAAVAVMLGPIFIPFFIVPHMEWLFWGWLKALIQYAFTRSWPGLPFCLWEAPYPLCGFACAPVRRRHHRGFLLPAGDAVDRFHLRDPADPFLSQFAFLWQIRRVRSAALIGGASVPDTQWMPPPTKDFNAAKRQFVELYGSLAVMNTYLKIAVLCLSLTCVSLVALTVKTYQAFANVKPLVIRINELGGPRRSATAASDTAPGSRNPVFLDAIVQQYYGRMRATVKENYTRSLYFLDGRLADATMEPTRRPR